MTTYSYTGAVDKVTVGQTGSLQAGTYDVLAYGGAGGAGASRQTSGGSGAEVAGVFTLTNGEKLEIVAAGAGQVASAAGSGGGGGGASEVFVLNTTTGKYAPLLIAAGGGGSVTGSRGGAGSAAHVTDGGKGYGGYGYATGPGGGGGGGGAYFNGGDGGTTAGSSKGGQDIANGAAGGAGGGGGNGGFGGGGGGGSKFAGGGGGFYGGDGTGAGGTSFVNSKYGQVDASHTKTGVETSNGQVVFNVLCFAAGTLIRTMRGDVPVEGLAVGDVAVTASGGHRPIRWLGHRTIAVCRHARPHDVMPVRVAAHAFAPNHPARDLYLSPGHPVLIGAGGDGEGGWLVPVMCLINGTTIRRVPVDSVTYWHVELDAHDILLAENLPAESYLEWGDRAFFAEGSDHALHNPDFVVPGLAGRCRPVAVDGPVVEAARHRLDAVFATRLAEVCAWPGGTAEGGSFTAWCDRSGGP